jgi:hypothetical protein
MAFKRISKNGFEGDRFQFDEPGTELLGYFLGTTTIPINGKDVNRHSFKTASGVVSTLGSANLDDGLADAVQGVMTRVVFEEMTRTKKGNKFKRFTVEQDADDVLAEGAASAAASEIAAPKAAAPKAAAKGYAGANVANKAAELKGQLNKTIA